MSSNLVPVGLDFLVAKDTATFPLQIFWFDVKIELNLSKKTKKNHLKGGTSKTRTATVTIQISKVFCEITSIKNYRS